MEINYIKLGERVRFFRLQANLSQEDLAEKAGIGVRHISYIENGNTNPSVDVLANIAASLNVTLDQLLIDSLSDDLQNRTDLNKLLLECSPEAASILVDNFTELKRVLEKYQIKE